MEKTKLNLFYFSPVDPQGTGTESLALEIKKYYERELLRNAEPNLIHDQWAEKYTIPQGNGHQIEWRKFSSLPKITSSLTEGVTPDGHGITVTKVDGSVAQYGDFVPYTDRIDIEAFDPFVAEVAKLQGAQAGLSLNTITRDALASATNLVFPGSVTAKASLASTSQLNIKTIFKAVSILRANNAPTFDGDYVLLLHPYVANDLMMDGLTSAGGWVDVNKYSNAEAIFKGEIGKIGGARIVTSSECKIDNDSTCPVKTAATETASAVYYSVFHCMLLGKGAYATTELSGAGLEYIVKPLGYKDALNQVGALGWKAMKGATILDNTRMANIMVTSATNDTASAN